MKQGQKFLSGFVKGQMPRGIALFFAAFALLNLIGDLRAPGFDANSWWIDLSFLPPFLEMPLILVVALALGLFAVRPPDAKALQNIITIVVGAVAVLAMINAGQFYRELFMGNIRSGFSRTRH